MYIMKEIVLRELQDEMTSSNNIATSLALAGWLLHTGFYPGQQIFEDFELSTILCLLRNIVENFNFKERSCV